MSIEKEVKEALKEMMNPVKHATDRADRARTLAEAEGITLGQALLRVMEEEKVMHPGHGNDGPAGGML